ncbi:hypothetical protein N9F48_02995 [Akkermansiaceae bacterium]|nr:hypothetical protein [Akkermansiaceae bacterium]MDA7931673.1 hypothetical protein [Akkermansiaceae bacterium]MDA8969015.1 hypothetical protein [Akkermansiaceae bacterium]MDB4142236.1 hypothetical protein [Akkermansiaceae bacterium]MDB4274498.1 hypothetical protein [Akkermansiaceae bacterium]
MKALPPYTSGISPSTGAAYGAIGGVTNHTMGRNLIDGYYSGIPIAALLVHLRSSHQVADRFVSFSKK